jgi:hypothetical protein
MKYVSLDRIEHQVPAIWAKRGWSLHVVFWFVVQQLVGGYQRFWEKCCPCLQRRGSEYGGCMRDLRFSRRREWRTPFSVMWRCLIYLLLVYYTAYSFTLKLEAVRSSEARGPQYVHHRENLWSYRNQPVVMWFLQNYLGHDDAGASCVECDFIT